MIHKLYTDASRRYHEGKSLCTIAGALLGERNRPVFEFVSVLEYHENSEYLELLALKTGLELCRQAEVENVSCFMDNLNSVKKVRKDGSSVLPGLDNLISEFASFEINHIPRDFNVYANALAKLPFNIELTRDIKLSYHNLNRSKKRFYYKLNNHFNNEVTDFEQKSFISVTEKIEEITATLQRADVLIEKNKAGKLFQQLYALFHHYSYHINNKIIKESIKQHFIDFIESSKISQELYPTWLKQEPKKLNF